MSNTKLKESLRLEMLKNEFDVYEIETLFPKSIDPDPLASERFGFYSFHQQSSLESHRAKFEISLHQPGMAFKRELSTVFPKLLSIDNASLVVIPTFQKCRYDLIRPSVESNWERNLLCAYFLQFGKDFVAACYEHGCVWADFTDPVDGLPVCGQRGNSIYPDVEGIVRLLKYPSIQSGSCSVIYHPRWQTNIYPGTLFVVGSIENIQQALSVIGTVRKIKSHKS
jgi:hypothetical protein